MRLTTATVLSVSCFGFLTVALGAPSSSSPFGDATAFPETVSNTASRRQKRAGKGKKAVFAHVVQGVFQNYEEQDYADDFKMARAAGIDAMAMNVGHDTTDSGQLEKAFSAAKATGMQLFFSFDMVYFSHADGSKWIFDEYLKPFGTSPAHYTYDGKVFVSTFSGEVPGRFLDAAGSLEDSNARWTALFQKIKTELQLEVYFAPDWNDVLAVASNAWGGGQMYWEAWPPKGSSDDLSLDTANSYMTACQKAGLDLIAPVSAFFHVHQRPDNNYVYKSGFLIFYHYTALIDMDPGPQFIELLSWNDFGESHYLGSTRTNYGPPAGSEGYANKDFDHTPLLTASAFYNAWFKTGSSPVIKTEGVIWYHRPHPKDLVASSDPVPKPEGADTMDDAIYVACFVPSGSKAANVIVTTGGKASEPKSVKEGVNLIQVPLVPGDVAVDLVDGDGKSLLSGKGVAIDSEISVYNFNYRAYILPEGADASVLLDTTGGVLDDSPVIGGSGGSTTTKTSATAATGDETRAAATAGASNGTKGKSGGSLAGSSGSIKATATAAGSSGSSSTSGGGGSATTEPETEASDLLSCLSTELLGLKLYVWIPLILAVPILILIAYIFTSHGTHAPRDADAGQAQHRRRLLSRDEAVSGSKGYSSSDEDEEEDRRWPRR